MVFTPWSHCSSSWTHSHMLPAPGGQFMAKKPFFLKDNSKPVWTEAFLCGTLSLSLAIVENMGKFSCVISGRMFVWLGAPGPHLTHSLLLHILCFSCVIHDLNISYLTRYRNPYFVPSDPVSLFHVSMVLWVVALLFFYFFLIYIFGSASN